MKKSIKISNLVLLVLGIVAIGYIVLTYSPLGSQQYTSKNSNITFNVPKLSIFEEECCMYSANFKNIRSTYSLKQEIEKELEKYEKITCRGATYYYDKRQDFTITEYHIEGGLLFNTFSIVYDKGKFCE